MVKPVKEQISTTGASNGDVLRVNASSDLEFISNSLENLLAVGNTTGGNDISLSSGDAIDTSAAHDLLLKRNGSNAITIGASTIDVHNYRLINLTDPSDPQDAATRAYVDANSGLGGQESLSETLALGNETDGYNITVSSGDYVEFGSAPAQSGVIRLSNNEAIIGRNVPNSADISLIKVTSGNDVEIGQSSTFQRVNISSTSGVEVLVAGSTITTFTGASVDFASLPLTSVSDPSNPQDAATKAYVDANSGAGGEESLFETLSFGNTTDGYDIHVVDGYLAIYDSGDDLPSAGDIRLSNNKSIYSIKADGSNDVSLVSFNGSNKLTIGSRLQVSGGLDLNCTGTMTFGNFNLNPGTEFTHQVIRAYQPAIVFDETVTSPSINQEDDSTASASGDTLTIHAQDATGSTSTGGNLTLRSGTGTDDDGVVTIQTGSGTVAINLVDTAVLGTGVALTSNLLTFQSTATNPTINQNDDTSGSATGDTLTIHAQDATGATSTGGQLTLRSGTGTSTDGDVHIQHGTTDVLVLDGTNADFQSNNIVTDGYVGAGGDVSGINSGAFRMANGTALVSETSGSAVDIDLIKLDGSTIKVGGDYNALSAVDIVSSSADSIRFLKGGNLVIIIDNTQFYFHKDVSTPSFLQASNTTSNGTAETFTIHSQDVTGSGTTITGGDLLVRAGNTSGGSATNGDGGDLTLRSGDNLGGGALGEILIQKGSASDPVLETTSDGYIQFGDVSGGSLFEVHDDHLFVANMTEPSTPTGGHAIYSDSGALKGKGTSGTITTMAAAEPHCPRCGKDAALEWSNPNQGWSLAVCCWCLTEGYSAQDSIIYREGE